MSSFIKIPFRYKIYGRLIVFYFAIWWYDFFIDIFIPDLYFKNFKYKHIPYVSTFIIYDLNNYFIWFSRLLVLDLILSFILKNNKVYFFDTSDIPKSFWGWAVLETIAIWVGYIIYFNIVTYCR